MPDVASAAHVEAGFLGPGALDLEEAHNRGHHQKAVPQLPGALPGGSWGDDRPEEAHPFATRPGDEHHRGTDVATGQGDGPGVRGPDRLVVRGGLGDLGDLLRQPGIRQGREVPQ